MKAAVLATLLILTFGLAGSSAGSASGQEEPSCQIESPPTIEAVDPPSSPPWRYVTVYGCNLGAASEGCEITFGGVRAWVNDAFCGAATIVAIPIAATSGPVVALIDGVASEPFPYTILPLDVGPDDMVPGLITVGVGALTDIGPIMERMGDQTIVHSFCYGTCWYDIAVAVGDEIEKSIQYYGNPGVLWASPVPVARPADGAPKLPFPAPPAALPPTGGEPPVGETSLSVPLMLTSLVLIAAGAALAATRARFST